MFKFSCYIFVVVLAAIVWAEPEQDGEDGYCNYRGLRIKEGETVPAPIGLCRKVKCRSASPPSISSLTCPAFQLAPDSKCHKSEIDLTKQYPHCCPRAVCPEE